ncbi:hypothetical protein HUJ04_004940 [Dendroctonus ponderosae]
MSCSMAMAMSINSVVFFAFVFLTVQICRGTRTNRHSDDHPNWQVLPTEECGYGAMSDRIIGGKEATLGQFPWIARLGYQIKKNKPKIFYLCAGSLINRWYVVTANHCFLDLLGDTLKQVRLGENFLKEQSDCENEICAPPVQDIDVQRLIRFEEYEGERSITYGDIGLIKLARPAEFHDFVIPICLPRGDVVNRINDYHLTHGTSVEVAGWGTTTAEVNRIPNKLMYVHMPVVNLNVCKKNFPNNQIDESQICVGIGEGKDSCVGDSGGPLMKPIVLDAPPKYFLFGIVSYGMKWCGVSAAIYTNVTHYMNWILDHMEPLD